MKKMPTLFLRDFDNNPKLVTTEVNPDAAWVLANEGAASEKIDGSCCMVRGGMLYKRHDRKLTKAAAGRRKRGETGFTATDCKDAPEDWEGCEDAPDSNTGHWPGWVRVMDEPEDQYHREAWNRNETAPSDGTYELLGPKVQGNPHGLDGHELWPHGGLSVASFTLTFDGIREYLTHRIIEGVVWKHDDGRMAKIKRSDFGLPWPVKP